MTDQQQEKPKQPSWLIKAGGESLLAGGVFGLGALVFGVPSEYVVKVIATGVGYSLLISWKHSKEKDRPKKKSKGRVIPFNHGKDRYGKSRTDIYPDDTLEYSVQQNGYVLRESYGEALLRKVLRKGSRPVVKPVESVDRPKILSEFIFCSHYDDFLVELREKHVKRFLDSAWRNREKHGKSLSERQWVRRRSQRPVWYKELPCPVWYYGMRNLIMDTQNTLKIQMIISTRNNWYQMACEPHEFLARLKWYEIERRKR